MTKCLRVAGLCPVTPTGQLEIMARLLERVSPTGQVEVVQVRLVLGGQV